MTKNNTADNTQNIKELDLDKCYIMGEQGEEVTFQQLADFYRGTAEILNWWRADNIGSNLATLHIANGFFNIFERPSDPGEETDKQTDTVAEREPFDLGDWLADQHHKAQLLADSIDEGDTEETAALLEQQAQAWIMLQEMTQSGELVHQS